MSFMPTDDLEIDLAEPPSEMAASSAFSASAPTVAATEEEQKQRRKQRHGAIVDYLKGLKRDQSATVDDIMTELNINLRTEQYVLDMIKSNPKIEVKRRYVDDVLFFKYRQKFVIRNKVELLEEIERVASGISMKEITNPPSYPGIEADCHSLIVGGDIIAAKNKEFKAVLYPRGQPFFTRLSGDVTAVPGSMDLTTSVDLRSEIRRGDAIRVGIRGDWYRVSSAAPAGRELERQTAPLSVSSERDMSEKNVYRDDFEADSLPLDGDYEGRPEGAGEGSGSSSSSSSSSSSDGKYTGGAYRHGCANSIRAVWADTTNDLKKVVSRANDPNSNAIALRKQLVELKLISHVTSTEGGVKAKNTLQKARNRDNVKKKRKLSDRSSSKSFNDHPRAASSSR
jgi:predicted transcriptional regulator